MKNYDDLLEVLERTEFSKAAAANILRDLRPGFVSRVVCELLESDDLLRRTASISYVHQLGFSKFILGASSKYGTQLRLHHWTGEPSILEEDIHNHRADFYSKVLAGGLEHTFFTPKAGNGLFKYKYLFADPSGASSTKYLEQSDVTRNETVEYTADSVYFMPTDKYHRVKVLSRDTISVSIWDNRSNDVFVYRGFLAPDTVGSRVPGVAIELARNGLSRISSLLRGSHATQ